MKDVSAKRGLRWTAVVLGVAAMLMVGGCSKAYWYSTTKDAQAFAKDRFECEADAANFSTNMGKAGKKEIVDAAHARLHEAPGYDRADEGSIPQGSGALRINRNVRADCNERCKYPNT
jgi:hypothetical protein